MSLTVASAPAVHATGTSVWVADTKQAWVRGVVKGHAGDLLVVSTANGERQVAPGEAPLQNVKDDEPVDAWFVAAIMDPQDMTDLAFLHEPGVLWNLKQRYSSNNIYTYTGSILIAVNPFQSLPQLYGKQVMDAYSSGDTAGLAPHVYAIASAAYKKMRQEGTGQAILVTGESGAGKTETSKLIMRYLAYLGGFKQSCWDLAAAAEEAAAAGNSSSIEQKVLESNPLLEAFGNAKTVRNDNSSRFGKYVEINFNKRGAISGAAVRTYLLERSRLVHLNPGERNYHIFYQLCDGATPEERQRWLLADRTSYTYLNQSDVYDLPGVCNASEFGHTRHAMTSIGITEVQQEDVFRILSALLHLGNISWEDTGHHSSNGSSTSSSTPDQLCNGTAEAAAAAAGSGGCPLAPGPTSPAALAAAAKLIGVDVAGLARALSTRTRATPDGPITSPLDAKAAASNRDALVKVIYARLFDWLVARINSSIGQDPSAMASIGLLDIYGFESFQFNDLEQFCINLANEKLQQHFNQHVFKWEQAEYEAEGIDWSYIEFVDNQDVLDLIEGKLGVVDLLDEQCRFPTATYKDLADKLFSAPAVTGSSRFSRTKRSTSAFTLSHYAGPVSYSLDNFLDKNKDFVVAEHALLLGGAGVSLLTDLFGSEAGAAAGNGPRGTDPGAVQNGKTPGPLGGKSLKAFQFVSVCSHFKRQLAELMALLHQLEPHYVRCIKPNPANKPLLLDDGYALHQLKCGGVMEAVRISCAGYPFRRTFADFIEQFWQLYPAGREAAASGNAQDAAAACRRLLATTGMSEGRDYQVGTSKVFLKAHQSAYLNKLHTLALAAAATKIQAGWRGYKARQEYSKQRAAIVTIQAGVRGMFGRRRAAAVRRTKAATRIQAAWRGSCARDAYKQMQHAAVVLQTMLRGAAARAAYRQALAERRAAAATSIQAAWRGAAVRQHYSRDVASVVALQAAWRSLAVRQQFNQLLQESRCACKIQRAWRTYQVRKRSAIRTDAAAVAAASVIQTIWRERDQHNSKVRRLQGAVRQYTSLHTAALTIQCAWRSRVARQALQHLQGAERRERFQQQRIMFEQQLAAMQMAAAHQARVLSRSSSRDIDSPSPSVIHSAPVPGTMPPPQRAAYGVTFAGLGPRSPSPVSPDSNSSSMVSKPPLATTTATMKVRPLPPPPPASYGMSYSGINGDINPLCPGEHMNQGEPPRGRSSVKLFGPSAPAAYGVAYAGIGGDASSSSRSRSSGGGSEASSRARLLEPAPAASYGVNFSGLQHLHSDSAGASGSSSSSYATSTHTGMSRAAPPGGGASRLFQGLRRQLSTNSVTSLAGKGCVDCEGEDAPLLDVVKADDSALLAPEERLFARLGSLVDEKGKVSGIMSGWKEKLITK